MQMVRNPMNIMVFHKVQSKKKREKDLMTRNKQFQRNQDLVTTINL